MMNKLNYLILAVLLSFAACTKNNEDFKSTFVEKMNMHQSVHFKLTEMYYYSNAEDTTVTPYEVWAVRDTADSLRKGYIWVDNNYRPYNMICEKGDFYLAIPPKKTSILYAHFSEDLISEVDWISCFLQPEKFVALIADSSNRVLISDTTYEAQKCVAVRIDFPENVKKERKTQLYILDKTSYLPVKSVLTLITTQYVYTDELSFADADYDKVDLMALKTRQKAVLEANPVERNGDNSETARLESMLHIGDDAPLFNGRFYAGDQNFSLKDYVGKNVIIVDFWYTHCPPCVRAMPVLSELNAKWKEKGLRVFGLNSVDNQPKGMANLNKFLLKRKISYDVIMIKPEVDMMYKVNGYPTMYLVDKNGKIVYAEIGYDETKFAKLSAKVEELLNK